MPYSKEVIERFEGVLNAPQQFSVGRFDPKDPNVATGMTGAPACGDVMKLQLKIEVPFLQLKIAIIVLLMLSLKLMVVEVQSQVLLCLLKC